MSENHRPGFQQLRRDLLPGGIVLDIEEDVQRDLPRAFHASPVSARMGRVTGVPGL